MWFTKALSAVLLLALTAPAAQAATIQLPRTGQTLCWDVAGAVIDCTGTGMDGETQIGHEWPSPRFTDNGNGTLTDTMTGLVWLQNANCFGSVTWQQALDTANSFASGSCGLSDGSVAGEWRLPNRKELLSISSQNVADGGAWLNSQGFVNGQHTYYWTSDTDLNYAGAYKWIVHPVGAAYPESWNTPPVPGRMVMLVRNPAQVTLSAAVADGSGSITSANPLTVAYGSAAAFTVAPDPGYLLAGSVGGTCPPGSFNGNVYNLGVATADCTVNFSFTPQTYTIATTTTGSGTLSCTPAASASFGTPVSCTATATAGNHVATATVDGLNQATAGGTSYTYSFGPLDADHTIAVAFDINNYQLTFTVDGNGSITGSSNQNVDHGGTAAAVTAVPGTGSHFVNWTGNNGFVTTTANPLTVTDVAAGLVVTAHFALDTYLVTPASPVNGRIIPSSPQTVAYQGATTFTLVPDTGYQVASAAGCGGTLNGTTYTTGAITGNCSISASFTPIRYTIATTSGSGGSITCTPAATADYNGTVSCTALADSSYHIANVTVDTVNQPAAAGTSSFSYQFAAINANHDLRAGFAINSYTVSYTAGDHGTLTEAATQSVDHGGSTAAVSAVPATGYHFLGWTGSNGFTSSANPLVLTGVTGNMALSAAFAINSYTVSYTAGDHGTLTGTAAQSVDHGGSTAAVSAVAATGYHFLGWTGSNGFTSSANPLVLAGVTGNVAVSATFGIDTHQVTPAAAVHGVITPATVQTVEYGTVASFTLSPDTGYRIASVSGCAGMLTGATYATAPVTADCTVAVSFNAIFYPLTATSADDKGTITCPAETIHGGSATCTMTAKAGFHLATLSDNGSDCLGQVADGSYVLKDVTAAHTVAASFATNSYTLPEVQAAYRSMLGQAQLSDGDKGFFDVAPLGADGRPVPDGVIDVADLIIMLRQMVGAVNW
ncbi:InlB B-repeat-containing protein [Geomonas paludis]|uniref:Bacterial repeat domain-containing protein n=1 Tax=Geomonas paludis TaxID=2740185 RepID=A0A6V8MXZ7_9BACT|nr:DUF1566 domain-containing protein [Geomonas paludis]GFO65098.1 hypothetical protein GMPD_30170 [Geomonas paludis]